MNIAESVANFVTYLFLTMTVHATSVISLIFIPFVAYPKNRFVAIEEL